MDVPGTKAGGVGYVLCARTSTGGEVPLLLWCSYETSMKVPVLLWYLYGMCRDFCGRR